MLLLWREFGLHCWVAVSEHAAAAVYQQAVVCLREQERILGRCCRPKLLLPEDVHRWKLEEGSASESKCWGRKRRICFVGWLG